MNLDTTGPQGTEEDVTSNPQAEEIEATPTMSGNENGQPTAADAKTPQVEEASAETVHEAPESTVEVEEAETDAAETETQEATATADEETPTPVSEAAVTSEADSDADIASDEADEDESDEDEAEETSAEGAAAVPTKYKRGDLVEGTIAETSPTSVTVQLDDELSGIIPGRELERMGRSMLEALKVDEKITVYVVNPRDHQGRVILSVNRALEEMDWKEARAYHENQEVYDGNIAGYNKGGLIVRFGRLRGFVPQSQIGDHRRRQMTGETPEELFSGMVNDKIAVKVMEVDRSRNRLILSERAATREQREARKAELVESLNVGEVREGTVVSLEDFGAFVDVGGAEGLVHLTEIAWQHVNHPRDVLKVGEKVKVEVISVDRDRKRIGLSIKRQAADPWDEVATTYQYGDLVQGKVTKLTRFGAFAQLVDSEEIEGLVHISELSDQRVNHPREVVEEGEKLTLRVVKIDVKNRRLGLSLKRVNSTEFLDQDMKTFANESDD